MKPEDEFDAFGLSAALDAWLNGITFVITTPRIWLWSLVPGAMLLFLFSGLACLGIWGSAEFSQHLFGADRHFWGSVGYWVVTVLLVLIALLIATLLALTLAEPLSAFALDKIVHAYQRKVMGESPPSPPMPVAIWISLRAIGFGLALAGPAIAILLLINVFFPPATVVTVPLKFLVLSWLLAWDLLDYPMVQRRVGIRARLRWVFRHFGAFTLFGMAWAIVAVVPGIVLVLLPMGVAGATQLVLRDDPRTVIAIS